MSGRRIERLLDAQFRESEIYREALTHRSAGAPHNERLEFLGDAVLGMVVAHLLFERFPQLDEGDLSRLRSHLVRGETLAEVARGVGLGERIRLGQGERRSGGARRDTILSNALEALIGAVYLSRGIDAARGFIAELWRDALRDLPDPDALKDPKTRLQELVQSRGLDLPEYQLIGAEGEDHARRFHTRCTVPGLGLEADAWGDSKRKSEQACARDLLHAVAHGAAAGSGGDR